MGNTVPTLIDFYLNGCGPCNMIAPAIASLANKYRGKLVVVKANAKENEEAVQKFEIHSFPTLIMMIGEQVVGQHVGGGSYGELEAFILKYLS